MPEHNVVPKHIADLVARVAIGEIDMSDARTRLRRWHAGLTESEKKSVGEICHGVARRMTAAADGLGQELIILVSAAQQA